MILLAVRCVVSKRLYKSVNKGVRFFVDEVLHFLTGQVKCTNDEQGAEKFCLAVFILLTIIAAELSSVYPIA